MPGVASSDWLGAFFMLRNEAIVAFQTEPIAISVGIACAFCFNFGLVQGPPTNLAMIVAPAIGNYLIFFGVE